MKKRLSYLFIVFTMLALLNGCAAKEEAPLVIVDSEEDIISFSLAPAVLDEVYRTQEVRCTYVQTSSEDVSFSMTGKYVDKVYVKEGSTVKKGDLLCELSSKSLEREIEDLKYNIKKNEAQLSYIDTDEALQIQDAWLASWNEEATKMQVESIQESYNKKRITYNDALEFDRLELGRKQKELRASRLYASMDGTIYDMKNYLEGSTTKEGEVILTIVDDSTCLFKVEGTQYKDLFKDGVGVNMRVIHSGASGDYIVKPYDIDNWTDAMYFSVFTSPENAVLEVGVNGTIKVEVDKKESVLSVPKAAVRFTADKAFVYTLNEDNIREIRYIETGIIGDEKIEVLSGLSNGEKVVVK